MILKVGDCIRLHAGGKDFRPGVVVGISNDGWYVVAIGTTTNRREIKGAIEIDVRSWEASEVGLDQTTWFTGQITVVSPESVDRVVQRYKGRCPEDLFLRIAKQAGQR